MSRTIKQDLDLYLDIKNEVFERLNIDFTQPGEISEAEHIIALLFENQNKWLLSDKISGEKQARMDAFRSSKK